MNGARGCTVNNNIIVNADFAVIQSSSELMWNGSGDWNGMYDRMYIPTVSIRNSLLRLSNPTLKSVPEADCLASSGYLVAQNNALYGTTKRYSDAARCLLGSFSAENSPDVSDALIKSGAEVNKNFDWGADPGIVDLFGDLSDINNANLRDDSEVYSVLPGFERIPIERIGIGNYDK